MQLKGRRVAVTGGAGFIGSHLVERLLARGNQVVVIDDFSTGSRENLPAAKAGSLEVFPGDVRNPASLSAAFEGCGVVFHLATHCVRLSLNHPIVNHEINATGTLNALEAARKWGAKRFIYCSSSEVFGNPPAGAEATLWSEDSPKRPATLYGASKLAGELYALAYHATYGLPGMVVRPFNSYGPRSHLLGPYGEVIPRFAVLLRAGVAPVIFGDGSQTRDFTYVEDTADSLIAAAECDSLLGDTVNVARGEEVSVLDLARELAELTGSRIAPRHLPERPGDLRRLGADIAKSKRVLGLELKTSIREGLGRYLAWLDSRKPDYPALARKLTERNWEEPGGGAA